MTILRSRPCGRGGVGFGQFALGDAVGPVAEIFIRHAGPLAGQPVGHHRAGLTRLDAAHPRLFPGSERAELRRDCAGGFLAELMAADAVDIVHLLEPVVLRELRGNSALAAKVAGGRNLHHRVPVDRRVIMCRVRRARRDHRGEIEMHAGLGAHFRRIDQAVAAHPDAVIGIRQIGNEIAALVVGNDDARELGRQFGGLGDHPDAGLRPLRAGHHAADALGADLDVLGENFGGKTGCQQNQAGNRHQAPQRSRAKQHGRLPALRRLARPAFYCRQPSKGVGQRPKGFLDQPEKPPSSRNFCSSGVLTRPSTALRCGNRPKRRMMSACSLAHFRPSASSTAL